MPKDKYNELIDSEKLKNLADLLYTVGVIDRDTRSMCHADYIAKTVALMFDRES